MKNRIVNQQDNTSKIDWGKIQIVKSTDGTTVLTTGVHNDNTFSGTVLISNRYWKVGKYDASWAKDCFTLITTPITIEFIPE